MNYTVYFLAEADSQILQLWLRSSNPEKVMDAFDDLRRILAEFPLDQGESRATSSDRIWFHHPFGLIYHVDTASMEVIVAEIRWIGY
jgi:hypothetical protein